MEEEHFSVSHIHFTEGDDLFACKDLKVDEIEGIPGSFKGDLRIMSASCRHTPSAQGVV